MSGVPLVSPGVLEAVTEHVKWGGHRKVGGILLGRPLDDLTRVDAALPARHTDEYAGEIAFPPRVWEEAYSRLDQYPGSRIVGWYHSHPGSGVAFSDYDRRLHTVLFGEPFSVALVLDPVAQRMAWFGWNVEQLWPPVSAGPAAVAPVVVAAPGRSHRAAVAALVALGILGAGASGYWLGQEIRPHPDREAFRRLERVLEAQASQLDRLRGELDRARSALAASQERAQSAEAGLQEARRALKEARRKLAQARLAQTIRYRIQPGDTLWDLAEALLGDGRKWPQILAANRSRIVAPDQLAIGQVIEIPLASGR